MLDITYFTWIINYFKLINIYLINRHTKKELKFELINHTLFYIKIIFTLNFKNNLNTNLQ